jgi:hypothetical protein
MTNFDPTVAVDADDQHNLIASTETEDIHPPTDMETQSNDTDTSAASAEVTMTDTPPERKRSTAPSPESRRMPMILASSSPFHSPAISSINTEITPIPSTGPSNNRRKVSGVESYGEVDRSTDSSPEVTSVEKTAKDLGPTSTKPNHPALDTGPTGNKRKLSGFEAYGKVDWSSDLSTEAAPAKKKASDHGLTPTKRKLPSSTGLTNELRNFSPINSSAATPFPAFNPLPPSAVASTPPRGALPNSTLRGPRLGYFRTSSTKPANIATIPHIYQATPPRQFGALPPGIFFHSHHGLPMLPPVANPSALHNPILQKPGLDASLSTQPVQPHRSHSNPTAPQSTSQPQVGALQQALAQARLTISALGRVAIHKDHVIKNKDIEILELKGRLAGYVEDVEILELRRGLTGKAACVEEGKGGMDGMGQESSGAAGVIGGSDGESVGGLDAKEVEDVEMEESVGEIAKEALAEGEMDSEL